MTDILLDTGTNEVELLEFSLNGQSFGLNVAKVCQMIRFSPKMFTRVPLCHKFVLGGVSWMDRNVPLIDLNIALGNEPSEIIKDNEDDDDGILLVVEINNQASAFVIDAVNRIHRLSWTEIEPINPMLDQFDVPFTGSVTVEGRDILLLDIEKILTEINPPTDYDEVIQDANEMANTIGEDLGDDGVFKIMIAEDSHTVRQILKGRLKKAGYPHVEDFESGGAILSRFQEINREIKNKRTQISDYVNLVISDIEMPGCDGLTLCKKIKSEMHHQVPVVLCSSLVNDALARKCKTVGADDYVTKREPKRLMELVEMYAQAYEDGVELGADSSQEQAA